MKVLVILIGIAVAIGLVLLVIAIVSKLLWSTSRGGEVERLSRMADKQLNLASKAAKEGKPGLIEDHLKLYNALLDQIRQSK